MRQLWLWVDWHILGLFRRRHGRSRQAGRNFLRLLRRAKEYVIVVSWLDSSVYSHPYIIQRITDALDGDLRFAFVAGPSVDEELEIELQKAGVEVLKLSEYPMYHFAIADARHIRYEGFHPWEAPVPANNFIPDAPEVAGLLLDALKEMPGLDASRLAGVMGGAQ